MQDQSPGFWTEFSSFAVKGNVLDLAVAVVVGNAFSGVVNSLVGDIITPVLGLVTNNVDFKTLAVAVRPDIVLKYGAFLQALFNFLVITVSIFVVFRLVSLARKRLFKKGESATPPEQKPDDVRLLEEIRDVLKERQK
jgi:large conductance mechanosensitive channel